VTHGRGAMSLLNFSFQFDKHRCLITVSGIYREGGQ
jgi:hypothetical protein